MATEQTGAYRIVVNGCDEVFHEDCLETEAVAKFYEVVGTREYAWLELRKGQEADEEDEVIIDSAWLVGQVSDDDCRYVYQHEFRDSAMRAAFPHLVREILDRKDTGEYDNS